MEYSLILVRIFVRDPDNNVLTLVGLPRADDQAA
jgi:hypothetical protein